MFHGVIHKITLAQFFLRHGVYIFWLQISYSVYVPKILEIGWQ